MTSPSERATDQARRLWDEHAARTERRPPPWAAHPVRAAFDVAFEAPRHDHPGSEPS